ncbi:lamin tail domain-containing protein [Plebeiibacterium sediminum]|uniref:Ig-like domain-containing protein n=1 Tax=Plebeiibacterium sediminum TaxID=2992112 RepID=A0AAE3SEU7_9BACT|nr:Ig-like domain-containing protein [Plebeiobacterium sediminum]MCW3785508.1 Ig-like domain-containing protein [Plebeiobacterium sediminum]
MIRYFFFILLFPISLCAQISENWNRSSFSSSPEWTGNTEQFLINQGAGSLDLNAQEESSFAYLFTPSGAINNAEWTFSVKMDFNPSSSNYCIVYLVGNCDEWSDELEGYYVKIGDTSDDVSLWKSSGGSYTKIIDGRDSVLDLSACNVAVKVKRDKAGNWELYSKLDDNEYVLEGEVFDDGIKQSNYFGLYCHYTKTRVDKFHFGYIEVSGEEYTDYEPPKILQHQLINGEELVLTFSEPILNETVIAENIKFEDENVDISEIRTSQSNIEIDFNGKVPNKANGAIYLSGFTDLYGNVIRDTTIYYTYFKPERYDVIITEIMVDPSPAVELPECEYIEVYNNTKHIINLNQYRVLINGKESIIPQHQLESGQFAVLMSSTYQGIYDGVNNVFVPDMGTLTNQEGEIVLVNEENVVSDAIQYPFKNIAQNFKMDGGWSLEKIDVDNQDLSSYNWDYSLNLKGGTPGAENSNHTINIDVSQPEIQYLSFIDDQNFKLHFNEALDVQTIKSSSFTIASYAFENVTIDTTFQHEVNVTLDKALNIQKEYSLEVSDEIKDYAGNAISNFYDWRVGVPEQIDSFNLCINEVLFNPYSEGVDFVEIYNRSDKIINLDDIYLSSIEDGRPEKLYALSSNNQLIFPGDFWVVCKDKSKIISYYNNAIKELIIECDIPGLSDDKGNIAIVNKNGSLIDYFEYSEDMHYELLSNQEGVSLERLNFDAPTNNSNNWHSASTTAFYATPTQTNSQYSSSEVSEKSNWIWVEEESFSPDSDGYKDYLRIDYKTPDVGYSGTVKVYNKNGIPVKTLVNNELLSSEGFIQWDGVLSNHIKAPMGIYIIFAEIFSPKGDVLQEKLVCVVTGTSKK